ncbi:hypothetical protein AALP_AA4G059500 [Arabis alpina]|uniref:Pathogenesis-related protein 1 n=1 Tax=Arabis alpina TaxID=50452 RepID=A0A087H1E9_ARAAL|nr:hypothetical protein AALP_AA4G059500 [Arabis alpina]
MNTFKTLSLLIVAVSFLVIAINAQNTIQDYLNTHNNARSLVGVPNLVWDAALANYALTYANSRKADCNLVHSNGPYGENLAKGSSATFSGVSAVNLWVAEKPYYSYTANSCTGGKQCLHYTQVVWRRSVKVGCARVQCNNTWWFVTCNYNEPGNYIGEYPY